MRIEESLFDKVNIGSTHPHDFIVTIIGTHLKFGEISLRLFGKMEEGCITQTTLPLANIYNTQVRHSEDMSTFQLSIKQIKAEIEKL
jgi:hypothetical protein